MKDIEFLPEHHIRARQNQRLRFTRMWLLIVMALAMVCWGLYSTGDGETSRGRLASVESTMSLVDADLQCLTALGKEQQKFGAHKRLVRELTGGGPRAVLVGEVVSHLPEEIFLSRLQVDMLSREVEATGGAAPTARARRGAKQETKTERVDRVRIEGYAADDLALARFLQSLTDSGLFAKGELAFSKDAEFRGRAVRMFAATFYGQRVDSPTSMATVPGGRS